MIFLTVLNAGRIGMDEREFNTGVLQSYYVVSGMAKSKIEHLPARQVQTVVLLVRQDFSLSLHFVKFNSLLALQIN